MEISVLGPLRVTVDRRLIPLPAKQQTLLAILAFQPNRPVSADRLVAALWGEDAPPTATKTLQSHVFQLRRLLAPDASSSEHGPTIVTDGHGYRLEVDPSAIDAPKFERLLTQARAAATSNQRRAFALLNEALALWRGPGLADIGDEPLAKAETERLGELRAAAFDELIQIRLALADYLGAIPELRREVSESPFREHTWASLMVALVRSGRKAEALLAYRDAEAALRRELDVEPSHELQDLAARIRNGDVLPVAAGTAAGIDSPASRPDRTVPAETRRGRRRVEWTPTFRGPVSLVAILGVVLVAAIFTAGSLLGTAPGGPTPSAQAASTLAGRTPLVSDSVGRLDMSGRLVSSVRLGAQPDAIALGAGSAWVSDTADNSVTRLDTSGSTVIQRIPVGDAPAGIAFGFGSIWVANSGSTTVSRINPTTNEVVAVIPVGTAPAGIAVDDRWVWVTNRLDHTLSRIDPGGGNPTAFAIASTPLGVATSPGSVWVADSDSNTVVQVNAQTGAVRARVNVGNGPTVIAATPGGDAIWAVNSHDGTVSRINTTTAIVTAAQSVGADPTGIGVGEGAVWVAVSSTSEIVKLDPTSGQILGRYPVGASPRSLVVASTGPLFTARASQGSHRGGTLNVVSAALLFTVGPDPDYLQGNDLPLLTNDALVGYKSVGGPDGQTLVPDLATSIPTSPDGGLTWTFQLRSGIRYSTGAVVRPSDVPGSFKRSLRPGAALEGNTEVIGSSKGCGSGPCDLSRGITFDDQAGTVTFHLASADPVFPSTISATFILPAGTPIDESSAPLAATGPYMVDRYIPGKEEHLIRNPQFHVWSQDAQPDGYPNAIDWTVSSLADSSSLVQSGAADIVLYNSFSTERLAQLRTEVPGQLHVAPSQKTWFEMMNIHIAPFNKPLVRQAINYAVNRQAVVDAWGGPLSARVTCQVIPPEYTGYVPYCPYTADPSANGNWLGPDLQKARTLIREAGVKGQRVTVWGLADDGQHAAVARYFTNLLNQLGFKATTRLLSVDDYFGFLPAFPDKVQMAGFYEQSATRSGSDTIVGTFTCPDFPTAIPYQGQPAGFCSRTLDARVRQAIALDETDAVAANALWAQIDQTVVKAAPAVMAFNPTDVTFVSQRVGNYQHNPVYQVMLDQLWVQ
jgi:peptide/nickel transport system substrate-binding protein